jgi:two-component system chemotaxis sensor kinase CheA
MLWPRAQHRNSNESVEMPEEMNRTEAVAAPELEVARLDALNEAASLLMQLTPGDLRMLVELRKCLSTLVHSAEQPLWVRESLGRAVEYLDAALVESHRLDPAVESVGRLIEAAMNGEAELRAAPPAPGATAGQDAPAASIPVLPADADRDLLADWAVESLEALTAAEAALLALETVPSDAESIGVVFRAFHTIKGTAAFLGLDAVVELAHHAESLLSQVRDGGLAFTPACADLALRAADQLHDLVKGVQRALCGQPLELPAHYAELIRALSAAEMMPAEVAAAPRPAPGPGEVRLGDILVEAGALEREAVEMIAAIQGDEPLGVALVKNGAARVSDVAKALRTQKRLTEARTSEAEATDSSVRVRTDRLNQLMDLVGELVVAQSMLAQDATVAGGGHHELARKVQQANKLVRELQGLSTAMRMVPLKPTFQKLARLVRDTARKVGKQVEFQTEGEETELDRNMVAAIADPLVHMVRNAIDHGLEPPGERLAAGKPATGTVRLAAYHQGGSMVLELSDDGRGMNREKIAAKAVARGLIESANGLSDAEVYRLIFEPGFSTAEQVTDVSGRGVGMDVVKRNIEALRGRVDITAEPGRGCTFTMRFPLTLAITEGMLVRVGGERYVVPTVHIYQNLRPEPPMLATVAGKGEVLLLHGEVIPLVRLHRVFGVLQAEADPTRATLVVVGDGSGRVALLVDEILGQQQFVAKPLGEGLGKVEGLAGGAVLGDGQVGLILDVAEVLRLAGMAPAHRVA